MSPLSIASAQCPELSEEDKKLVRAEPRMRRTWAGSLRRRCPDSTREQAELSAHYAGESSVISAVPGGRKRHWACSTDPMVRQLASPQTDAQGTGKRLLYQLTQIRRTYEENVTADWTRGPDACGVRDRRAQSPCRCRSVGRRQCAATGHRRESTRRPAALGSSSRRLSAGSSASLAYDRYLSGKRRVHERQHRRLLLTCLTAPGERLHDTFLHRVMLDTSNYVNLELETDRPYLYYDEHKIKCKEHGRSAVSGTWPWERAGERSGLAGWF